MVLILFGADKIPSFARTIGKGVREFRRATEDIKRELESSATELKNDFNEQTDTIVEDINQRKTENSRSQISETPDNPYSEDHDISISASRTFIDQEVDNTIKTAQNTDTIDTQTDLKKEK